MCPDVRGGGSSKLAFTISEILITLAIIGVVAAITLPVLINNIQNRQNIAKWKKMYSVINQAYLETVAEGYVPCVANDYGNTCIDSLIWTRQTEWNSEFIDKMMSKFKVRKYCDKSNFNVADSDCGPSYYTSYKTLAGGGLGAYNFSTGYYNLVTGKLIMFGGTFGGPWISVDVDGFRRGKDTLGKDLFVIRAYDDFLRPMGGCWNIFD